MKIVKIEKMGDEGTSNPIVNRICFQFLEILETNTVELDKESLEKLNNLLYELMEDFLKVEEYAKDYLKTEQEVVLKIKKGEIRVVDNTIKYESPTPKLKECIEHFLIRSVLVLRKVIRISNIIFEEDFKSGKDLHKYLKDKYCNNKDFVKFINSSSILLKELYDDRGNVEHEKLGVSNFDIKYREDGFLVPILPTFIDRGIFVNTYIREKISFLFNYTESMLAFMLDQKIKYPLKIVYIKEEERKKFNNFKYRLDIDINKLKNKR